MLKVRSGPVRFGSSSNSQIGTDGLVQNVEPDRSEFSNPKKTSFITFELINTLRFAMPFTNK